LIAFVAGSIFGGFVGLIVSVIFEDYLTRVRDRMRRRVIVFVGRIRGRPAEDRSLHMKAFNIGPLKSTLLVVEGDGEQVINEQDIHIIVDPEHVELPAEMARWRRELLDEQRKRAAAAQQHFWNGKNYAVSDFSVSRKLVDEEPELFLRLKHSDYGCFLASQQADRKFKDGSTPRSRYLDPYKDDPTKVPDFMSASFGANAAVLTADKYFIFSLRSSVVGSRPDLWSVSANEGLSRTLDNRGRSAPNLYDVMRRGIKEELAIENDEYTLELLSVFIDTETHQWGGAWVAALHHLNGADVIQRRARGVGDKWEHKDLKLISWEPENVLAHLLEESRNGRMVRYAPAVFYFALVRQYGRRAVDRAIRQIERSDK
jgi:hypothetical protein